jgi:hypothetical protein
MKATALTAVARLRLLGICNTAAWDNTYAQGGKNNLTRSQFYLFMPSGFYLGKSSKKRASGENYSQLIH